ncbi:hypothetical protein H6P81_015745 [Aristolochia fimbriata]|uniref:Uncharacterized protein n=1 Tax=Aristolochia fimbriata TaxID=158543 RepID=A0AAV7E6E0_ARIFI|nr:hypothetical protein H6P81_015745 [Aristolochia fimbriata]
MDREQFLAPMPIHEGTARTWAAPGQISGCTRYSLFRFPYGGTGPMVTWLPRQRCGRFVSAFPVHVFLGHGLVRAFPEIPPPLYLYYLIHRRIPCFKPPSPPLPLNPLIVIDPLLQKFVAGRRAPFSPSGPLAGSASGESSPGNRQGRGGGNGDFGFFSGRLFRRREGDRHRRYRCVSLHGVPRLHVAHSSENRYLAAPDRRLPRPPAEEEGANRRVHELLGDPSGGGGIVSGGLEAVAHEAREEATRVGGESAADSVCAGEGAPEARQESAGVGFRSSFAAAAGVDRLREAFGIAAAEGAVSDVHESVPVRSSGRRIRRPRGGR